VDTTRTWNGEILLVSDPTDLTGSYETFDRRIDRPLRQTVDSLQAALEQCASRVHRFDDLTLFTQNIAQHRDSLVFPYWFGEKSRSRHGLVPAICEAAGLMFVGADAFSKIVSNDKELSKAICRQAGLSVPTSIIISNVNEIEYISMIPIPAVVKPNYEGTSLGISQDNLCWNIESIKSITQSLIQNLDQPVIIEEFIRGREFSACMMSNENGDIDIQIGTWKINGHSDFLDDRINSYDLKLPNEIPFQIEIITETIDKNFIDLLKKCFVSLGKVDLLRIDGRINEKGIVVIELTPDIYLGADGEFCQTFGYDESNYTYFVSRIINNCLKGYKAHMPVS
jgi:D-alanine-D-alanine ligase